MTTEIQSEGIVASSGNVFADPGFADAAERGTKVRLCVVINRILAQRGMTQVEAAQVFGMNQPKVSALTRYKLEGFSVERLMLCATALGYDVRIEVRPHADRWSEPKVFVVDAA